MTAAVIIGIFLVSLASVLSVCVGAGGGAITVPIFIILLRLSSHHATALSQSTMFGSALAAIAMNVIYLCRSKSQFVVDVNLILLLGPIQLAGVHVGTSINSVLSEPVLYCFTLLTIIISAYKTYGKAQALRRQEFMQAKLQSNHKGDGLSATSECSKEGGTHDEGSLISPERDCAERIGGSDLPEESDIENLIPAELAEAVTGDGTEEHPVEPFVETLSSHFEAKIRAVNGLASSLTDYVKLAQQNTPQILKWIAFLVLYSLNSSDLYFNHLETSGIITTSAHYGVKAVIVIFMCAASIFVCFQLRSRQKLKALCASRTSAFVFLFFTFLAGVAAGTIGLGGGLILVPLMLSYNVPLATVIATSTTLILFSSGFATCIFVSLGVVDIIWAAFFICLCFAMTFFGKIVIDYQVKRFRCQHVLLYLFFAMSILALVAESICGLQRLRR